MREGLIFAMSALAIIGMLFGYTAGIYDSGYKNGYQQGQIDALNDIIKYELVEQEDGSTKWEKINED